MPRSRNDFFRIFVGLVIVLPLGCGASRGDLGGTVTYKGKPVCLGFVQVVASDGMPKSAPIQPDGTYVVKDIRAGPLKIAVNSPNPATSKINPRGKSDVPPPAKPDPKWFPIPDRYGDFDKSNLTFTLRGGLNDFPIELID